MKLLSGGAAALALFLAACGGDGDPGPALTQPNQASQTPATVFVANNFPAATRVIGQVDFTSTFDGHVTAISASTVGALYGSVALGDDGSLFVPDISNSRGLRFNAVPAANGASADAVLGPGGFNADIPRTDASGFRGLNGISIARGKMAVADGGNHRVLIYNTVPTVSNALADVVLGQATMTTMAAACGATAMNNPEGVFLSPDGKLIVTDSGNNRVLVWNTVPTVNGAAPDAIIGQSDAIHCASNDGDQDNAQGPIGANTFNRPTGAWSDGTRLAVVDTNNHRVLIWNQFPTAMVNADVELGHPDFTRTAANDGTAPSARTLFFPYLGIHSNGQQLAIADQGNNRVLIWNSWPTQNFQPADRVVGQSDFTHGTANDQNQDGTADAAPTAQTLSGPSGVALRGNRLFVSDTMNNRVLVYEGH